MINSFAHKVFKKIKKGGNDWYKFEEYMLFYCISVEKNEWIDMTVFIFDDFSQLVCNENPSDYYVDE